MEEFRLSTRIIHGEDPLAALKELSGKRVLVVSDGFLAKEGLLSQVTKHLTGSTVEVFQEISGEPTLRLVAKGVAALERFDAQVVVGFGGGSAMDCAKALGYCAGKRLPIWCIPTTAGTGSEVTNFAVLTNTDEGVKYPLVDPSLMPEVAILDKRFLSGVPAAVTADTGMDVLTHAAEACVAERANAFTDALAEKAFSLAYEKLPEAQKGDLAARGEMLFASTLAGAAFHSAGLGVCHALAHAVGGQLHAPHGRINAILLPRVIEANAVLPAAAKKYGRLSKLCGLSPNPRALSGAIRRLNRRLGLPERLKGPLDLEKAAKDALADPCMRDNGKTFTQSELVALLREAVS